MEHCDSSCIMVLLFHLWDFLDTHWRNSVGWCLFGHTVLVGHKRLASYSVQELKVCSWGICNDSCHWKSVCFWTGFEGCSLVPSIYPLETLHNSLSLKQVDEFLTTLCKNGSETQFKRLKCKWMNTLTFLIVMKSILHEDVDHTCIKVNYLHWTDTIHQCIAINCLNCHLHLK